MKIEITIKVEVDVPKEMDLESLHIVNHEDFPTLKLEDGMGINHKAQILSFETDWVEEK